ncbi:MAG: ABC transporter ATP-binding protein [Cetobacterium sp.]|uniref:ABC transporter ATP-binding protein n=1 Tax=Cetobacterium sp. TaxID=2071632 RepID=UPI002FC8DAAA
MDASFSRGKLTGILGPNGCGKSTLLKLILGYYSFQNGEISLEGKDIKNYTSKELSKKISFVPQGGIHKMSFSVKEFLSLGRIPHIQNHFKGLQEKDEKIIEGIVKELELEKFRERKVSTLSGGEYQRVLLGRALIQEGDVLLLDEPTSALDMNHAIEFLEILSEKIKKGNLTGIIVIHDLNLASLFCDEIIFINEGQVGFSGKPKEVLEEDILEKIYGFKSKILKVGDIPYIFPQRRMN